MSPDTLACLVGLVAATRAILDAYDAHAAAEKEYKALGCHPRSMYPAELRAWEASKTALDAARRNDMVLRSFWARCDDKPPELASGDKELNRHRMYDPRRGYRIWLEVAEPFANVEPERNAEYLEGFRAGVDAAAKAILALVEVNE